ncbi:hypothetical protein AAG570_004954 [Ranatra chinensis]|uniref:Uncharacterized protein n=1 Tax=Ranatra chinensis TaxID=642074 RepID=A0ABD0XZ16_9HEMI
MFFSPISRPTESGYSVSGDDTGTESIRKAVTRLSEQARAVMEHYKQEDPIGLPGAPIPDPMVIPKIKKGIFDLKNLHIYGLSKFKIEKFDLDLDNMHPMLSPPQRVKEIFLTAYPERAVFADEVPQAPYCLRIQDPAARSATGRARSLLLQLCPAV